MTEQQSLERGLQFDEKASRRGRLATSCEMPRFLNVRFAGRI